MRCTITFLLTISAFCGFSQNIYTARILDIQSDEAIYGVIGGVEGTMLSASSTEDGILRIADIPDGRFIITFRMIGYLQAKDTVDFPNNDGSIQIIYLKPNDENVNEIVVSAMRTSRTISDIPTRVETIDAGELEEKSTMQPANAKMILTESTGIQTQQTSAASANASIRIQGLDGKYTQLLRDGFPLYSGFSSGLSIMQIPPLDLKRVEVIKGSSSTLYGGGAIAGLINFVTKVPTDKQELSLLVNGNMTKASDVSAFYLQKFHKIGISLCASQNLQAAYDPNHDTLSDIPKISRYTINPKLFFYLNSSTTLSLGLNATVENRLGGDMYYIAGEGSDAHSYFERNTTDRFSTQFKLEKVFFDKKVLTLKNTLGLFDRSIASAASEFSGRQYSSYTELSYLMPRNRSEWVVGGNLWTDRFEQRNTTLFPLNNELNTIGIFAQHSFKAGEKLILESGMRLDATNHGSILPLPKLSLLYKFSQHFTSRLCGGLGYKSPTLFSEEAESRGYRFIEPLHWNEVRTEKSMGGNFDVNYRTQLTDELSISFNQLFFYTRLNNPLTLSETVNENGNYAFFNSPGFLETKGFETNVKITLDELALYGGYTYIDAVRHYALTSVNPLTARSRIYMTLNYEVEERMRIAYECFYTGKQTLSNGQTRTDYWVMGISAQYNFNHLTLFANAENFTDTRQTRYESIYSGTIQQPQFKEIWSPTDGFIFNVGFKVNVW